MIAFTLIKYNNDLSINMAYVEFIMTSHEVTKSINKYYFGPPLPSGVRQSMYSSTIFIEHVLQCTQF